MKQEKELNEAQERGINTVKRRALKHQEKREYFKNEPRSVHIAGSADTTGLKQTVRKEKESLSKASKKADTGIAKEFIKAKTSLLSSFAAVRMETSENSASPPSRKSPSCLPFRSQARVESAIRSST